jgi:hypothetical protein
MGDILPLSSKATPTHPVVTLLDAADEVCFLVRSSDHHDAHHGTHLARACRSGSRMTITPSLRSPKRPSVIVAFL